MVNVENCIDKPLMEFIVALGRRLIDAVYSWEAYSCEAVFLSMHQSMELQSDTNGLSHIDKYVFLCRRLES